VNAGNVIARLSLFCHVAVTIKLDLAGKRLSAVEKTCAISGQEQPDRTAVDQITVSTPQPHNDIGHLKEKLLTMASFAETAVNRSIKALMRRDDELARETDLEDDRIDRLEIEIDELAVELLGRRPGPFDLRMIAVAMKISHNLERVGDEATTISRRVIELSQEPQLRQVADVPPLANVVLPMLKEALDAFVTGRVEQAMAVIPRDKTADEMNRRIQQELAAVMTERPSAITRCLSLMVISKCLERIGDHATNVAEDVVYLYEGRDIRHSENAKKA